MLGFLIGTVCLIGLVKVIRMGRGGHCGGGGCGRGWHGRGGWGRGWGRHHGGGWGGWGGDAGFRGGSGFFLRGIFERLDTTPGQEKVIKEAVEEIFGATRTLRGELEQTRRDIASAVRSGTVDEVAMGELFARHDDKLRELRKAVIGSLSKVNEALDEDQRKRLADLLERGFGGGWGGRFAGGPYRERGGEWA
jgi:hypothetical protein